jgi:hypothetical protein
MEIHYSFMEFKYFKVKSSTYYFMILYTVNKSRVFGFGPSLITKTILQTLYTEVIKLR